MGSEEEVKYHHPEFLTDLASALIGNRVRPVSLNEMPLEYYFNLYKV